MLQTLYSKLRATDAAIATALALSDKDVLDIVHEIKVSPKADTSNVKTLDNVWDKLWGISNAGHDEYGLFASDVTACCWFQRVDNPLDKLLSYLGSVHYKC